MSDEIAEPAWLTALCDQRLALVEEKLDLSLIDEHTFLMTPLTEPREGASKIEFIRWDRSCDSCGQYCPKDKSFSPGQIVKHLSNGHQIMFTFGVCSNCRLSFNK
jgi:hypothetical protein